MSPKTTNVLYVKIIKSQEDFIEKEGEKYGGKSAYIRILIENAMKKEKTCAAQI